VAKGETLSQVDNTAEWQDRVRNLLDAYLSEFGISDEATRARWIKRVVEDLAARTELVATEDILEDAVEHMRDLIEARVAMASGLDPAREHKEVAQILVVLLNKKNADSLNMLFEHIEIAGDFEMPEHLQHAIDSSLPVPVPVESPLAMPVQTIELRSINPLRRFFRRSA
jgi:hypothetical protein